MSCKPPHKNPRTPAWQQPLYDLSTCASALLDTWEDLEDDVQNDVSEMYELSLIHISEPTRPY